MGKERWRSGTTGGSLMATDILMPALSPTMEEGKLAKWLVKEGDTVKSGDILAEIETDKATMEFEAVDEGRIGRLLVAEGTEGVKVNQPIATLVGEGEKVSAAAATKGATSTGEAKRDAVAKTAASETPKDVATRPIAPREGGAVATAALSEPEVPEGTEMVTMTVR